MAELDKLISEINKEFKENCVTVGIDETPLRRIRFTSPAANYQLYGGLPLGRFVEFYGRESSGKTTMTLDVIKNAQTEALQEQADEIDRLTALLEKGKNKEADIALKELNMAGERRVLFVDAEQTFDLKWAEANGVDTKKLLYYRPSDHSAEIILETIIKFIRTGSIILIVLDSLGELVPQEALDKDLSEEARMGGISKLLKRFCNSTASLLAKHNTLFIGINQITSGMSAYTAETTTGGNGWRHNCTFRINFSIGEYFDETGKVVGVNHENPAGHKIVMKLKKSKICRCDRKKVENTLNYRTGIDVFTDAIEIAVKSDVIIKSGAWYDLPCEEGADPVRLQGKENVKKYYIENPEEFNQMLDLVNTVILSEED